MRTVLDLPNEVLLQIVHVSVTCYPETLCSLARTSKFFNQIVYSESVQIKKTAAEELGIFGTIASKFAELEFLKPKLHTEKLVLKLFPYNVVVLDFHQASISKIIGALHIHRKVCDIAQSAYEISHENLLVAYVVLLRDWALPCDDTFSQASYYELASGWCSRLWFLMTRVFPQYLPEDSASRLNANIAKFKCKIEAELHIRLKKSSFVKSAFQIADAVYGDVNDSCRHPIILEVCRRLLANISLLHLGLTEDTYSVYFEDCLSRLMMKGGLLRDFVRYTCELASTSFHHSVFITVKQTIHSKGKAVTITPFQVTGQRGSTICVYRHAKNIETAKPLQIIKIPAQEGFETAPCDYKIFPGNSETLGGRRKRGTLILKYMNLIYRKIIEDWEAEDSAAKAARG